MNLDPQVLKNLYGDQEPLVNPFPEARKYKPQDVAKGVGIQKQTGVDAILAAQRLPEFQGELDQNYWDKLVAESPKTAKFMSASPVNAALLQPDADSGVLTSIAAAAKYLVSAPGTKNNLMGDIAGGWFKGSSSLYNILRAGAEITAPVLDPLAGTILPENPLRRLAAGAEDQSKRMDSISKYYSPSSPDIIQGGVTGGVQSFVGFGKYAPLLAFGPAGGAAALTGMVAETFGSSYGDARDKGLAPVPAAAFAVPQAVVEYATEKIPMSKLLGDLASNAGLRQMLVHQIKSEVPGEQVATILQDLNEWAVLHPEKPFSEYIAERPSAAAQTLISTIVGVGGNVAVTKVIGNVMDKGNLDEMRAQQAEEHAKILGDLQTTMQASEILKTNPETLTAYAQALADEGAPQVFVDADTLIEAGVDLQELAQAMPSVAAQLETLQPGGDLVIPTGELLTNTIGATFSQPLIDNLRTDLNGMSRVEAKEYMDQKGDKINAEIERVLAEREGDTTFKAGRDEIQGQILQQLNDIQRFTPAVNKQYAALAANFYSVMAARTGMTVKDFASRYKLGFDANTAKGEWVADQPGSRGFAMWSAGAPLVSMGTTHEFSGGSSVVVEALHGTTNANVTQFDRSKANIESDFGAGFYASNTPEDVAGNYANEAGPDLTNRVEQLAERIEQDEEFDGDHGEALRQARARLSDSAPNTMKVYIRFSNPAVLGGRNQTYFDYNEEYNEELDEYGEPTGKLVDFVNALDEVGGDIEVSAQDLEATKAKIFEAAQGEGLKFDELISIVKENMLDAMSLDDGAFASSEVLRQALEIMGFDGVIDQTVSKKFKNMEGMNPDTTHFIAFRPEQIKSATGNNGNYDGTNPNILEQAAVAQETDQDHLNSLSAERISPRLPTAVKATENPNGETRLQPDLATAKIDPVAFGKNIALMQAYPNFENLEGAPDQVAETMIQQMVDNLMWLHDHWKPEYRSRSKMWYVGGNRIAHRWSNRFGVTPQQVAAVIAATSPQKDWFQNVSLAERILEGVINNSTVQWSFTKNMQDAIADHKKEKKSGVHWAAKAIPDYSKFEGKSLRDLYNPADPKSLLDMAVWIRAWDESTNPQFARVITPEGGFTNDFDKGKPNKDYPEGKAVGLRWQSFPTIAKTLEILMATQPEQISQVIGANHKVRSFFNNIIAPYAGEDVTIDTHAVAASLLRPLGSADTEVAHNFGGSIAPVKDAEGNIIVAGVAGTANSAITGLYGTYAMYAEAYRRAAEKAGVLPREMQSITWEAVRGLFRPEQKNKNLKAQVDAIWRDVAKGSLNVTDAREQISKLVGGIVNPAWIRSAAGENETATDSSYAQELPGSGRDGGTTDARGGVAASGAVQQNQGSAGTYNQTWKSALTEGITQSKMGAAPASGWKDAIKGMVNKGQIKQAEVEWSGINEWLDLQQGKVTKDQVQAFLDANGVQVTETVLGDTATLPELPDGWSVSPSDDVDGFGTSGYVVVDSDGEVRGSGETAQEAMEDAADPDVLADQVATKYQNYTLPGGTNYREVLLTLPRNESDFSVDDFIDKMILKYGAQIVDTRGMVSTVNSQKWDAALTPEEKAEHQRLVNNKKPDQPVYRSSHWDEPNILAHIRINDRTDADGNKVLFVEEIQSDWGQAGKKKGFKQEDGPAAKAYQEYEAGLKSRYEDLLRKDFGSEMKDPARIEVMVGNFMRNTDAGAMAIALDEKPTYNEYSRAWNDEIRKNAESVPVAPFVTNTDAWVNLALKRVIKMAVDGGYDKVAFVNGEQSAERYDLSKQISDISYKKNSDGSYTITAKDIEGRMRDLGAQNKESDLEGIVGKEIAQKIVNGEGERYPQGSVSQNFTKLSGLDLKVGGEGMKAFYDQIIAKAAGKLADKLGGAKMEEIKLELPSKDVNDQGDFTIHQDLDTDFSGEVTLTRRLPDGTVQDLGRMTREAAYNYVDDPKNYKGQEIRQMGFTITDKMRASAAGGMSMFQNTGGNAARGQIAFGNDITQQASVISLLKNADLSTFIHESGHFFLEVQADLAKRIASRIANNEDVTDGEKSILADFQTTLKWMGVTGNQDFGPMNQWAMMNADEKRPFHEKFARGFEAYAFEGKAPSLELQSVFQTFRAWLVNVYRVIKDKLIGDTLNVQLNDEVRGVMDRMLATTEAIEEAEAARAMGPLFKTAEEGGMDLEAYKLYHDMGVQASQDAIQELQAKGLRDMQWLQNARSRQLKALQKQHDVLRKDITMEIRKEVMAQPIYRAWTYLTARAPSDMTPTEAQVERNKEIADHKQKRAEAEAAAAKVAREELYAANPDVKGLQKGQLAAKNKKQLDINVQQAMLDWDKANPAPEKIANQVPEVDEIFLTGKLKTEDLRKAYGSDPKAIWRKLSTLRMTSDENGTDPDLVADIFKNEDGSPAFGSGDELVKKLVAAEDPKTVIEGLVDQRMLEEHGDLATPEGLERAADMAVHNDARVKFVATELRALHHAMTVREKVPGQKHTVDVLVKAAKEHAEALIARLKVRDIKPAQYAAAEARAAKAADKARGDLKKQTEAKRNQLINMYAAKAGYAAQEEVAAAVNYFKKFDKVSKSIDPEYQDQIHALLERFDLREISLKKIDKRNSLKEWAEAQPIEPNIPAELLEEANRKSYKEMTVEEVRGLRDTIKQIEHIGRLKNKLLKAKDQREFAEIVGLMSGSIVANGGKARPVELEGPNPVVDWFAGVAAAHRKMGSLFRQMDGNNDAGPMYEYIGRSMNEAGATEDLMTEDATKQLQALYAPLMKLKGGISSYRSKVFIPAINTSLTRGGRLAVALNWGNEANRQRVMDGDNWTAEQVGAIIKTLTPVELEFVNKTWEFLDSYWPQIAAKEKRLTGTEPEKVESTPFTATASDGTKVPMRGGYYPIKYDANRSDRTAQQDAAQAAKEMMQGAVTRATTRRGHTKARMETVDRAVRKDLNVITQHVTQVVHDLAWHEWLIDTNRLLSDKAVAGAIRDYYGPQVLKTMRDNIMGIATADVVPQTSIDQALLLMRSNVTRATMGASLTTAFLQPFGLTQSMVRIGPKHVLRGLARWGGDAARMESTIGWIHEKSDFMRLRAKVFNKELREIRGRVGGKSQTMMAVDAGLFYMMQKMQMIADVPTWIGQYEKSIAEGLDEAAAVAMADRAVLESQGGGQTKDLAEVQRKHPLLTQFYSYFSVTLNLSIEQTAKTDFKNPRAVAGWLGDMALLMVIPAILPAMIMFLLKGGDEDEPTGWAKRIAEWQLGYLMGSIVGIRELSGSLSGFDYAGPPAGRLVGDLGKVGKQAGQGELDEPAVLATAQLIGTAFGIPITQVLRSYKGWKAWDDGKEGAGAQSVLFGPPPKN
jgi:hypothetical protein